MFSCLQMLIAGTNIYNNNGQSGGAVFQDTISSVTMIQSNLANNSATMAGGAIYSRDNAVVSSGWAAICLICQCKESHVDTSDHR